MDILRKDYPKMLHESPDFSIYHDEIEVVDPSGVQLHGLGHYKSSFRFLQTLLGLIYSKDSSYVQSRMVYDFARSSIRVSWNAVLVPKKLFLGNLAAAVFRNSTLYVDGISVYKIDVTSGLVIEHRVEHLVMNGRDLEPPYNVVMSLLGAEVSRQTGTTIPIPAGAGWTIQ